MKTWHVYFTLILILYILYFMRTVSFTEVKAKKSYLFHLYVCIYNILALIFYSIQNWDPRYTCHIVLDFTPVYCDRHPGYMDKGHMSSSVPSSLPYTAFSVYMWKLATQHFFGAFTLISFSLVYKH